MMSQINEKQIAEWNQKEHGDFVLKGHVCFSKSKDEISITENGYIVSVNGISQGVFTELPEEYRSFPLHDFGDQLIVPGMSDLHVHAPQYTYRGLGMDMELLDWLKTHTFPEESKYASLDYAERAYTIFADDLKHSATTRAVVFATMHAPATELLMDKLEAAGLCSYVGKVNMDRNSTETLTEASAEEALRVTEKWIEDTRDRYQNTRPILTPRFTPSCTDALMRGLGDLRKKYHLPVQSHLSENQSEIAWVKELCPWSSSYGDTYDQPGLLDEADGTIMAHCVYTDGEELALLKERGVYIAHCPQSNINLASGIAPVKKFLELGMHVGLGTDVAGGSSLSMFRAIQDAVAVSKLRWRIMDQSRKPLTTEEGFYLATLGGGAFFGKVGSFLAGYEMDALVLDNSAIRTTKERSIKDALEQYIYLAQEGGRISAKFVKGRRIF